MTVLATVLLMVVGLAGLIVGAILLVRGATRLALVLGVPPLVTGLTVVAFATSAPELAIAVQAALDGRSGLTVGNVVGSSLINIMVILGVSALIAPLEVSRRLVRADVPIMIGAAFLLFGFSFDGTISRVEGLALVVLFATYTFWSIRAERAVGDSRQPAAGDLVAGGAPRSALAGSALLLGGLALLVLGSGWLVDGAVFTSRAVGVSELMIGLTIIAFGTASPEMVTSFVAASRGERDLAVGNAVGSVTFNVLVVVGFAAILSSGGLVVPVAASRFDIPVLLAATVACLPICFRGYAIARWEGALLLVLYVCYLGYLALDATGHEGLPAYSAAMLGFVLPLVAATLLVFSLRFARRERADRR